MDAPSRTTRLELRPPSPALVLALDALTELEEPPVERTLTDRPRENTNGSVGARSVRAPFEA